MSIGTPHVLVMPCPTQGHVIPLLELSQCLAKHGFSVTFVNSEYSHHRVLKALEGKDYVGEQIQMVSIPDGLKPGEDRNGNVRILETIPQVMSGKLEEIIEEINGREGEKIACVIADGIMGWAIEVAKRLKIKHASLWTSSAASLALSFSIQKLIDEGIIDSQGTPIKEQKIELAPNMPPMYSPTDLFWASTDLTTQKIIFDFTVNNAKAMKMADWLICNSTYDLERVAFTMVPKLLPIGPLLASNRLGNSAGYFWSEDSNCLKWLDQQQPNSVIYVAFGSSTVFDKTQFQELALGLELCNRPFLWVVRSDILNNDVNDAYPEGFQDRVATRSRMISWAPQQKVLSHPSVACFLSHCGWNSTMEGVSNGVPFLCLPYYAEQFLDASYICDDWKVGMKFNKSESGLITREEIKNKVNQILGDESFKARALELKEKALSSVREGGSSYKTFQDFLEWIKA
ncbi:UDP-glycosyltransferase [Melia azedarach]|uniref:UDP-glycosyltransferase n=1 Tax=Melia azedarach TaxID=155640 RepID=A0ACC1X7M0_MELAZ|nr:UDP-glycosyltransferase [Melia azedarach]